jgi:hypothetical protein
MTDISETAEDQAIEAQLIIEGITDNGQILDVVFPFYSGPAGVRDIGGDQVEFAYF